MLWEVVKSELAKLRTRQTTNSSSYELQTRQTILTKTNLTLPLPLTLPDSPHLPKSVSPS